MLVAERQLNTVAEVSTWYEVLLPSCCEECGMQCCCHHAVSVYRSDSVGGDSVMVCGC